MHTRDGIKDHYSIQQIKYITWLISRNSRTKGPLSGCESSLLRTKPRQCHFENVWHRLPPVALKPPSKGTCPSWRQPSQKKILEFGTQAPHTEFPHPHHPAFQICPVHAPVPAFCPGFLMVFAAKCDGLRGPLCQPLARGIFLNSKLPYHLPA